MNKLVAFYFGMFVIMTIFSSFMEGGGGFATTELNGAIDEDDVVLTVDSTVGFLDADFVVRGDERIAYTWKDDTHFGRVADPCTRGYDGTKAVAHDDNSNVFSPDSGTINTALGFNVASTGATAGTFAVVTLTWNFLTKALPNLIMWDYAMFTGNLIFVRYFLMAIGVGLVIHFGVALINAGMGILKR